MSARKRKSHVDIQPDVQNILDIVVQIKPSLNDPKRSASTSLISHLHKIAALAESIHARRPRTNQDWLSVADTLDREGVNLWNASSSIKGATDNATRELLAALRLAGFRLIEAGLEQKQSIETLIHVLQLASKTGAALSDIGRHDAAAAVLTRAAEYEEKLQKAVDPQNKHVQARVQATVLYLSSRMTAAWGEGNESVADFMLQKITENDQRLPMLPPRDRESLAAKLLEMGKSIFRRTLHAAEGSSEKAQYQDGVKWLQKAFSVIELSAEATSPYVNSLKRSILRTLARGYYLSSDHAPDNLDRAEVALNELISTIDGAADHDSAEYQQLRWMKIAILKKRPSAESELLDAFKSIIDHMSVSDGDVTDILQELRALYQQHVLVTSVHQYVLQKVLLHSASVDVSGLRFVDRLLLSLLFHCSKDADHSRAMKDVEAALALLSSAEFKLPKVPTTACLTLLWQFGDRHHKAKRWAQAADWYLCCTHDAFQSMARSSHAKSFRKAALCYIQTEEYNKATAVLRRCPGNEAATQYVMLLVAVHQGLEDEAIAASSNMAHAPDFDRKMLLLATQLASEHDMKMLLLSVLETLLDAVQKESFQDKRGQPEDALLLIRCVIRLVVKLMGEPGANSSTLIPTLLRHFGTAKALIEEFHRLKRATIIAKDISWLWRTAYNCAIQGCTDWQNQDEAVATLFDIARDLLDIYCSSALAEVDSELYMHFANASFASIAGRVFALRKRVDSTADTGHHAVIAEHISAFESRIQELQERKVFNIKQDAEHVQSFVHISRVFHVEIACQLRDWKKVVGVIEGAAKSSTMSMTTFEAIADILWAEKDCPIEVLFTALEAILHTSLDRSSLSVEKFSRWLRAICTVLLSRNSPNDRTKAIGYVEQAVAVLKEHTDDQPNNDIYPMDERQWLLGTSYNTGIECFHASLAEEAKRWFESATVICRFVPDGKMRAAKISETYSHLLARFAPPQDSTTETDTISETL